MYNACKLLFSLLIVICYTAALSMKTLMIANSWSTSSLEEIAQANCNGPRWLQFHFFQDNRITMDLIRRAEQAGYNALVITIDFTKMGKRLTEHRNKFYLPSHLKLGNFNNETLNTLRYSTKAQQQPTSDSVEYKSKHSLVDKTFTWDTITWVKSFTKLPVIAKGILTGEDAKLAVQHGVDGIIVSNHGGRQLDGVLATVRCV